MTEDELDILQAKYRRARKAFTEIHSIIEEMGKELHYISTILNPPYENHSLRRQITPLNEREIQKTQEMPSSEIIISAMEDWSKARKAVIEIWKLIPAKDRADFRELPANMKDLNFYTSP